MGNTNNEKLAMFGNIDAQKKLGWKGMYEQETSTFEYFNKALFWYTKAAEQGDVEAQESLGRMYFEGEEILADYKKSAYWLQKAIEQGNNISSSLLSDLNDSDEDEEEEKKRSYLFNFSLENGGVTAAVKSKKTKKSSKANTDNETDLADVEKLASLGDPDAQYRLAQAPSTSSVLSVFWLKRAAEQGHKDAQFCLGYIYAYGELVPLDCRKAGFWLQKAADHGDARALTLLNDYPYNLSVALADIEKLAHSGDADAQFRFGGIVGWQGINQQALSWYHKAAEQGHIEAQFMLVATQFYGNDKLKNYKEAEPWLRVEAKKGDARAMGLLRSLT